MRNLQPGATNWGSFLPLLLLVAIACDRGGASSDTSDVVRSVITPAADAEWRTAPTPRIRIGGTDADTGAYELEVVVGAHLLPDGGLVLANSGSSELRWYDSTGRFERAIGRQGEGPAEFRLLISLWAMQEDSIAVSDATLDRISVFTPRGEFVRTLKLERTRDLPHPNPLGHLPDGTILGVSGSGRNLDADPVGKIIHSETRLARFAADGNFLNEILRFRDTDRYVVSRRGSLRAPFVPFAPDPSYAIWGSNVLWTSGREFLIEERDGSGRLLHRISADIPVEKLTSEHRAEFAKEMRLGVHTEQDRVPTERYLADAPYPENLPVISRILPTKEGMLWVQSHSPDSVGNRRWWVLDRTGHWIGYASTPRGLRVLEVTDDRLLGVAADSLGVQSVLVYDLVPPERLQKNPPEPTRR